MSDMNNQPIKRFIAGAVCPACETMDTIRRWQENDEQHRECVQCGYSDKLNAQGNIVPKELSTRVNQTQAQPKKATASHTMQFFPNPKLKQ